MGLFGWLRAFWQRDSIPPPGADMLGAATLVKEKPPSITQGGEHVSSPYKLPHVVIPPVPPRHVIAWGVPPECFDLSKAFEGFRANPYLCSAGVWTIGYGSTRDVTGKPVTRHTPPVSDAQARDMAARDLERAAAHMSADFPNGLPPRWWAVGVLLCNNMGRMSIWGPTLMALLREGDWQRAAAQMRHYRNADGVPSLGLRRRRWAEAAYALGMDADQAQRRAWAEIRTPDDWPALG